MPQDYTLPGATGNLEAYSTGIPVDRETRPYREKYAMRTREKLHSLYTYIRGCNVNLFPL